MKIHFDFPTIYHLRNISDTWNVINALIVQAVGSLHSIHINALPCNSVTVPLPADMASAVADCVNLRALFLGTVRFPTHLLMGAIVGRSRPILQKLVLRLRKEFIDHCFATGRTPSAENLVLDNIPGQTNACAVPDDDDDRTARRWFWNRISNDIAIRTLLVCDSLKQSEREKSLLHSVLNQLPTTATMVPGLLRRIVHWNTNLSCHDMHDSWMMCNGADTLVVHNHCSKYSWNFHRSLMYTEFVECIVAFLVDLPRPPRTVIFAIRLLLSNLTTREEMEGFAELQEFSPAAPGVMTVCMRVNKYPASEEDAFWVDVQHDFII